jgi:hypothetical protein
MNRQERHEKMYEAMETAVKLLLSAADTYGVESPIQMGVRHNKTKKVWQMTLKEVGDAESDGLDTMFKYVQYVDKTIANKEMPLSPADWRKANGIDESTGTYRINHEAV